MKQITLALTILISTYTFAQDSAFTVKKGLVVWSKIYQSSTTFQQLVNAVKKASLLTNIDTFDNTIVGQSIESYFDYRGAGYSTMNTPIYLTGSTYRSAVVFEYKDSAYKVSVTKIIFVNQSDTKLISPVLGSSHGELTALEDYALKKDRSFKPLFFSSRSAAPKIIDYTFTKAYSL